MRWAGVGRSLRNITSWRTEFLNPSATHKHHENPLSIYNGTHVIDETSCEEAWNLKFAGKGNKETWWKFHPYVGVKQRIFRSLRGCLTYMADLAGVMQRKTKDNIPVPTFKNCLPLEEKVQNLAISDSIAHWRISGWKNARIFFFLFCSYGNPSLKCGFLSSLLILVFYPSARSRHTQFITMFFSYLNRS